jgi:hypothetical protein
MDRKKNIFDMVGSLIPGYRGYAEREGRRQCDKILRDEMSLKLYQNEKSLESMIETSISIKDFNTMNNLEKYRKKINTLTSKIKHAPYGNSGFFSDSQLKENELFTIYQKDFEIAETLMQLENMIKSGQSIEISLTLEKFEMLVDNRNQYIKEYK